MTYTNVQVVLLQYKKIRFLKFVFLLLRVTITYIIFHQVDLMCNLLLIVIYICEPNVQ